MEKKYDQFGLGLAIGILSPLLVLLLIYLTRYREAYSLFSFLNVLFQLHVFTSLLSLCAIPNLLFFFLFTRTDRLYSARGILGATFVLAIIVLIIKLSK
jgi:hypothetical protein